MALPSARSCLLYTSDAADERSSVDLGGRRIIKKKTQTQVHGEALTTKSNQNVDKEIKTRTKETT